MTTWGMDLSCQGPSRQDEDCSVEEASTKQLTDHENTTTGYDKGHIADKFEIVYANADGLQNKFKCIYSHWIGLDT